MAEFAFTDGFVLINTINMSAMAKKLIIKASAAELENTTFGATFRTRIAGLKDYVVDIEWNQDFAAAQVDALLFPLFGTVTTFEVRPTSGARSVTNPAYTGSVLIADYTPLDGAVGDLEMLTTSWKGAAPLLRLTA